MASRDREEVCCGLGQDGVVMVFIMEPVVKVARTTVRASTQKSHDLRKILF